MRRKASAGGMTAAIAAITVLMGLLSAPAHAKAGEKSAFTAPYTRGNPGTVTDCYAGADVCSASGTGGAAGVFDIASNVTRRNPVTAGTSDSCCEPRDLVYGFANASQRIKVPTGVTQATVTMRFHASDPETYAEASHGWASSALMVFADASSGYCGSAAECTAKQGSATLKSSRDPSPLLGPPSNDVGPDAVVTLTITSPSGSTLPTRPLYVIGSAVSISSLTNNPPNCLGCLEGRAGSASSSATVTLQQMTVSFSCRKPRVCSTS